MTPSHPIRYAPLSELEYHPMGAHRAVPTVTSAAVGDTPASMVRVLYCLDDAAEAMLVDAAEGHARPSAVDCWQDFLVESCDLAVIDPALLGDEGWNVLCEVFASALSLDFRAVLVGEPPTSRSLPRRNLAVQLSNVTTARLRQEIEKAGRAQSPLPLWKKAEPRIVRLMDMVRRLDQGELRLRDVAARFEISMRTVQRDLDVLLCADWPIVDGDEPGVYRFPEGYSGICCHCDLLNYGEARR